MYLARSRPTVLTWFMDASWSDLQHPHSGTLRPPGGVHTIKPGPRGFEVVEGRLGWHEAQVHETARRVVDEHQERARRAAVLEPPMLGAVDLHELAHAVPAGARLVHGLEPLLAVAPEAVSQHPLPDRLDPEMDAVSLSQLLASEGWTEVGVVGLDQPQRLRSERRRIAAVAAAG